MRQSTIILSLLLLLPFFIYSQNNEYFSSELLSIDEINKQIISKDIIKKGIETLITGCENKKNDNVIEEYFNSTMSSISAVGEPELIFNSQAPWFYRVPLLDREDYLLEYFLVSPYNGQILSYPTFYSEGKYFEKSRYVFPEIIKQKIEDELKEEIVDYKILRICQPNGLVHEFLSVSVEDRIYRCNINQNLSIAYLENQFDLESITEYEISKNIVNSIQFIGQITDLRYTIDNFNEDYLIPEFDDLPVKNQGIEEYTIDFVNNNLEPIYDWGFNILEVPTNLSYKCLSYGTSTIADWWNRYNNGNEFEEYFSLTQSNGYSFLQEYGISPRLVELVYHENVENNNDSDFDYVLGGIYKDPITNDDIPFDLKGYCRILTHDDISYIPQETSEPLFTSTNSSYNPFIDYYSYNCQWHSKLVQFWHSKLVQIC
jgi:hypothetical protein